MAIRKYNFILLFVILPLFCTSQNLQRKGEFSINLGLEFRITPFYTLNDYSTKSFYTTPDIQSSGLSLNLGTDYFLSERLKIGFNSSFRYDLISRNTESISREALSSDEKGLLLGYHLRIDYYFKVLKKGDLLASAGISLMNRNSEVLVDFPTGNAGVEYAPKLIDHKYTSGKFSIGYERGRSQIMLGMYVAGNTGYFTKSTTFMMPFINYSFDFIRLQK